MTRTRVGFSWCLAALSIPVARVAAQEAVTIGGHVSAGGNPVQGATVRIPALGKDIDILTNALANKPSTEQLVSAGAAIDHIERNLIT